MPQFTTGMMLDGPMMALRPPPPLYLPSSELSFPNMRGHRQADHAICAATVFNNATCSCKSQHVFTANDSHMHADLMRTRMRTARARAAGRWSKSRREASACRGATQSNLRTQYMHSAVRSDCGVHPSDNLCHAVALKLLLRTCIKGF